MINRERGESGDIATADMCYGDNTNGGCQKWGEAEIPTCRNPGDKFDYKPVYSIENTMKCAGVTGYVFLVSTEGINIASNGDDFFYILIKNADHKGMYNSNYYIAIIIFPKTD